MKRWIFLVCFSSVVYVPQMTEYLYFNELFYLYILISFSQLTDLSTYTLVSSVPWLL